MSDRLLTAWCWLPSPGNVWRVTEMMSGLTVDASSKEEAIAHFNAIWNRRASLEWKFESPPQPRRSNEPRVVNAPAIEGETDAVKFHRALLRRWHPDLHSGKRKYSAQEITAVINELWESASRG